MAESVFTTETPAGTGNDAVQYEMGMKFRSSVAGNVIGVRYWRVSGSSGAVTGHLWTEAGVELASASLSVALDATWNEGLFSSPVAILANTTYVISANIGTDTVYRFTASGLASQITNGNVFSVADGHNGVFGTVGTFPNGDFGNSNYFRDVLFEATSTTPPAGVRGICL